MGYLSTTLQTAGNTVSAALDHLGGRGTKHMSTGASRLGAKDGDQVLIAQLRGYFNEGNTTKVISTLGDIQASRPDELKALLGKGFGEPDTKAIKLFRDIIKEAKEPEARNLALEILFDYLKSDQASTVFTKGGAVPRSHVVEVLDQAQEYLKLIRDPNARLEPASKLAATLGYHQVSRDQKVAIDRAHTDAGVIPLEAVTKVGEHKLSAAQAKFNLLNTLRHGGTAGATIYSLLCDNGSDSVFFQDNRRLIEGFIAGDRDSSFSSAAACHNAYEQIKAEMPSVSWKGNNLNLMEPVATVDPATGERTRKVIQEFSLDTFLKEFCSHESGGQERAIHNLIGAYFSLEAQKQDIQTSNLESTEFSRAYLVRDITSRQINMLKAIFAPDGMIATEGKFGKLIHDRAVALVNSKEAVNMAICTAVDALSESNVDAQVRKFTVHFQNSFGKPLEYKDTSSPIPKPVTNAEELLIAREQLQTSFNDELHDLMTGIFKDTGVTSTSNPTGFYKLVNDLNAAAEIATEKEAVNTSAYNADDSDISNLKRQCAEADNKTLADDATVNITLNVNQTQYLRALMGRSANSPWDKYKTTITPDEACKGVVIKDGINSFTKTQALRIIELMKEDGSSGPATTMLARRDNDRRTALLTKYGTDVRRLLRKFQGANPASDAFHVKLKSIDFKDALNIRDAQTMLRDRYVKPLAQIGSEAEVYIKAGEHLRFLDSLGSKRDITNPEAGPLSKAETRILDILRDDDRAFQIANPAYVAADKTVTGMKADEDRTLFEAADFLTVSKYQPKRQAVKQDGMLTQFLRARDITGTFHDPEKARFAGLEMLKRIGPGSDPVEIEARKLVYTKILGIDETLLTHDAHLKVQGKAGELEFSNRLNTVFGPTKFSLTRDGKIDNGGEYAKMSTIHHRLAEIDTNLPQMHRDADTQFYIDMSRFGMFAWKGSMIDKAGVLSGLKEIKENLQVLRTTDDPRRRTELISRNLELSGFATIGMGGDHHDRLETLLSRSHVINTKTHPDTWTKIMQYIESLLESLLKQQAAPNN